METKIPLMLPERSRRAIEEIENASTIQANPDYFLEFFAEEMRYRVSKRVDGLYDVFSKHPHYMGLFDYIGAVQTKARTPKGFFKAIREQLFKP